MLRDVVRDLVHHDVVVSVIARSRQDLDAIKKEQEDRGRVNPIAVDYHDSEKLKQALDESVRLYGDISLAIVWIHRTAIDAPKIVAQCVKGRFFHIRPSSVADVTYEDPVQITDVRSMPNIEYHQIILGCIEGKQGSRWLTNAEIAQGVIDAVSKNQPIDTVGII